MLKDKHFKDDSGYYYGFFLNRKENPPDRRFPRLAGTRKHCWKPTSDRVEMMRPMFTGTIVYTLQLYEPKICLLEKCQV